MADPGQRYSRGLTSRTDARARAEQVARASRHGPTADARAIGLSADAATRAILQRTLDDLGSLT